MAEQNTGGRRLLALGDSNTYGYDPRSYLGGRYPRGQRWTGLLEAAGWEVVNWGVNGMCIPSASQLPSLGRALEAQRPLAAVTVMLGSNDLLQMPRPRAERAAEGMEPLLRLILSRCGEAWCLLIAPPPMRRGTWVQGEELIQESAKLSPLYRDLAAGLGASFADAGAWGIPLAFDGVHFLPEGHAAFARGLLELLS